MTRLARAVPTVILLAALIGCGEEDDPVADPGPAAAAPAPESAAPSAGSASASASAGSASASTPSADRGGGGLESVLSDVRTVAPRLEGFFRGQDYPRTLDEVIAALPDAGVQLAPGNRLGAYRYDADAVEFVLCVENAAGAYATYDTAPMATGDQGEDGGCPEL